MKDKKPDYTKQLDKFSKMLKTFPEVIGIAYKGSTATKKWDKYSDLDIDIYIKDSSYKKFLKKIPRLLSWWGELKFYNNYEDYDEVYGFVGKNYFKVEIDPINERRLSFPDPDFKDIKIIYDKTGKVSKAKKISQKVKKVHLDKKYFEWSLLDTRSNFLYIANKFARGQKWEAMDELNSNTRKNIFKLLARTKGLEEYQLGRQAEKVLTKKEWKLWKKSMVKRDTKYSIKKAIKYAWLLMKHVEEEFNKKSNKKLGLKTNDKEIYRKIMELLK